jgi:hypothetical protein
MYGNSIDIVLSNPPAPSTYRFDPNGNDPPP